MDNGSSSHTQSATSIWIVGRNDLYRDRSLAARISWRAVASVGDRNRGPAHRLWWDSSTVVSAYLSRVDVGRAYFGVDQYQDSARYRVLWIGDSNRCCIPAHGEGFDETEVRRVKYDIQSGPISEAPFPYEIPILTGPCKEEVRMGEFVMELWAFMKERKKFWLLPIVVVLVLLGSLIVLTQGSAVAPFIYTLF